MKRANRITAQAVVTPGGLPETPPLDRRSAEQLFAGPRPASMRRGLDPAFLLFDRELLERLHAAADDLSISYQVLVQRIAREHIDEY